MPGSSLRNPECRELTYAIPRCLRSSRRSLLASVRSLFVSARSLFNLGNSLGVSSTPPFYPWRFLIPLRHLFPPPRHTLPSRHGPHLPLRAPLNLLDVPFHFSRYLIYTENHELSSCKRGYLLVHYSHTTTPKYRYGNFSSKAPTLWIILNLAPLRGALHETEIVALEGKTMLGEMKLATVGFKRETQWSRKYGEQVKRRSVELKRVVSEAEREFEENKWSPRS